MSKEDDVLLGAVKRANDLANAVDEQYRAKAFEMILSALLQHDGRQEAHSQKPREEAAPKRHPQHANSGHITDKLGQCTGNPPRYLIAIEALEAEGTPATAAAIAAVFKKYRIQAPKNPSRDLRNLVAKGWIEDDGTAGFRLLDKGMKQIAALTSAGTT